MNSIITLKEHHLPISKLSEEKLTELCKQDDQQAQRELYDRYANKLYRVCFRYLKHEFDTEDVLVTGFVKVYQNIHKFEYRGKGSLEGWLKRIMINECLMHLRKKSLHTTSIDHTALQFENGLKTDGELLAEDIFEIIKKLPNGYRTVFNLYVVDGYNHKEIAEKLGISENTSKSQLSKARAMLRKILAHYGLEND